MRVVAAIATPEEGITAQDIRQADVEGWRTLGASLEKRGESRRASYASGGTQMPTWGGSKSSYSNRLCRPRKKALTPSRFIGNSSGVGTNVGQHAHPCALREGQIRREAGALSLWASYLDER